MVFKREWDSSCPRVWDQWEADGKTFIIQDLRPQDDDKAVQLLMEQLCTEEPLLANSDILNDSDSIAKVEAGYRIALAARMSIACYTKVDDQMTLVALNVCIVDDKGEKNKFEKQGKALKNVFLILDYIASKKDAFEFLGLDRLLHSVGLIVTRENRGSKLGASILAGRELLGKSMGIRGTAGVFTAPASQKLATYCGFTTIAEVTWSELADAGIDIPREDRIIKYMVKKYE